MKIKLGCTLILFGLASSVLAIDVLLPQNCPQAEFAKTKIEAAAGAETSFVVRMELDGSQGEQAYIVQAKGNTLHIRGDAAGLMYGGLELAERMRFGEKLSALSLTNHPFIKRRGVKMTISLDARSPDQDVSDTAAYRNVAEVWSEEFWHGFLDRMAECRFNTLTLWCDHSFRAMLKLDDYPEVAFDGVAVPTYQLDDPLQPQVKPMPIAQKIEFWRHVMAYAKARGIDLYFITSNPQLHGTTGKYGIAENPANDAAIAYLRESVKQFVLTYPDLKGLGIGGEHGAPPLGGENQIWNTYGLGIVDAKAEQPSRDVHFIHGVWDGGVEEIVAGFIANYPDSISVGFDYARARLYSVYNPSFFNNELKSNCEKQGLSCWMNLNNDTLSSLRWGDPDFVRMYMLFLPHEPLLGGYQMGSNLPRQLDLDKHWYSFMLWGRMGYDPMLNNDFFKKVLGMRFPDTDIPKLFNAWKSASEIVPMVNTWHWRDWDDRWSVETCMSKKAGYHSVNHFIEFQPLTDQSMLSIDEYVRIPMAKGLSPLDVANNLDRLSLEVRANIQLLQTKKTLTQELHHTLSDLEAFAFLGHYYADKIRGSTELHRFRVNGLQHHQKRAVNHLKAAVIHWRAYAKAASRQDETPLPARAGQIDWAKALLEKAQRDIEIARAAEHNVFPPSVLN